MRTTVKLKTGDKFIFTRNNSEFEITRMSNVSIWTKRTDGRGGEWRNSISTISDLFHDGLYKLKT